MDTTNLKLEDLPAAVSEILDRLEKIEGQLNNLKPPEGEKDEGEFLNIDQASNFLKIAKGTLYGKVCKGEIPCYKPLKRLYFSKTELIEWIKSKSIYKGNQQF